MTFLKLELGLVKIKDICFSDVSKVEDGVIYVNKEELINLLIKRTLEFKYKNM